MKRKELGLRRKEGPRRFGVFGLQEKMISQEQTLKG